MRYYPKDQSAPGDREYLDCDTEPCENKADAISFAKRKDARDWLFEKFGYESDAWSFVSCEE